MNYVWYSVESHPYGWHAIAMMTPQWQSQSSPFQLQLGSVGSLVAVGDPTDLAGHTSTTIAKLSANGATWGNLSRWQRESAVASRVDFIHVPWVLIAVII